MFKIPEPFSTLKGKTFKTVKTVDDSEILFISDKEVFSLHHERDCCETVYIDSVEGDLSVLENSEILLAEESRKLGEDEDLSETWTFYKLATVKGYVDIRFYGTSNGYYSESAELYRLIGIIGRKK